MVGLNRQIPKDEATIATQRLDQIRVQAMEIRDAIICNE